MEVGWRVGDLTVTRILQIIFVPVLFWARTSFSIGVVC